MRRKLAIAVLPLALGGCLPLPITIATASFSGVSYLASGKSTTDHVLSATMEKDCALTRPVMGEPVCRDLGPNGEGGTPAFLVANYPGDRDDLGSDEQSLGGRLDGAFDLTSLDPDSREIAAAPLFLAPAPRVSVAGIIVTRDQIVAATESRASPIAAETSWATLAPSEPSGEAEASQPRVVSASSIGRDSWVVLASFREIDRARVMAARYSDRRPRIVEATIDGGQWHRVVLGPMTPAAAHQLMAALGRIDGREPWVVRVDHAS